MFATLDLAAALHVCLNMRAQDKACIEAMMGDINPEVFAVNRWQTYGAAWAFYQEGVPVVIAGISQPVPWLGEAWMVATEGITQDSWKKIIRYSRNVFRNASRKIQRIDAHCIESWPDSHKYPKLFGFKQVNIREKAGKEGQNVIEFAIIGALP